MAQPALRYERRWLRFPSAHQIKKKSRHRLCVRFFFCKQAVYGERNSEIVRPIRAYNATSVPGSVPTDSASPAAKSGLRKGDVIQEVNEQPVKSAKDLLAISKKLKPNEKILMRVYSQGRSGYVALEPK